MRLLSRVLARLICELLICEFKAATWKPLKGSRRRTSLFGACNKNSLHEEFPTAGCQLRARAFPRVPGRRRSPAPRACSTRSSLESAGARKIPILCTKNPRNASRWPPKRIYYLAIRNTIFTAKYIRRLWVWAYGDQSLGEDLELELGHIHILEMEVGALPVLEPRVVLSLCELIRNGRPLIA